MTKFKHIISFFGAALFALFIGLAISFDAIASKNEKKDAETEKEGTIKTGTASWYGQGFHGKKTATGDKFDMNKFTCASNKYPLGTWLKVTNLHSGKTVVVRVNDRMHPRMKRIIDLSKGAAKEIGMVSTGVAKVRVEDLGKSLPGRLP